MSTSDLESSIADNGGKSENTALITETESTVIAEAENVSNNHVADVEEDVTEDILQQALAEASGGALDSIEEQPVLDQVDDNSSIFNTPTATTAAIAKGTPVVLTSNVSTPKHRPSPLGSKDNPIRIVQQGNTYTSMQQLSQAQIQQIVQVLQRQNITAKSINGASTAVFNPETNTRIVYRVVQPHGKSQQSETTESGVLTARKYHESKYGKVSRKRQRTASDEEDISSDSSKSSYEGESDSDVDERPGKGATEMSPNEKLKKKREKPVTRSGRVSKPPKHMVKDYKHIHRVDWYEDYDDDDGGYSDIYDSDAENENSQSGIKKKFGCQECNKAYIGPAGLARHYKLTGHGNPDEVEGIQEANSAAAASIATGDNSQPTGNELLSTPSTPASSVSAVSVNKTTAGRGKPRGRPRKKPGDELWKPPPHVKSDTPEPKRLAVTGKPTPTYKSTPGTKGPGRPPLSPRERKRRRAARIESFMDSYTNKEILSSLAPRLAADGVSLYDVLEAGLGSNPPDTISYTVMLQRYMELQAKMIELAQICLRPIKEGEQVAEDKEAIQIAAESIAQSIGVKTGYYEVSDVPREDNSDVEDNVAGNMESQMDELSRSSMDGSQQNVDEANTGSVTQSTATLPNSSAATLQQPESSAPVDQAATFQIHKTVSQTMSHIASSVTTSNISQSSVSVTAVNNGACKTNPSGHFNSALTSATTPVTNTSGSVSLLNKSLFKETAQPNKASQIAASTAQPARNTSIEIPLASSAVSALSHETTLQSLAHIMPGDILQIEGGESFVIPEGASIVQTPEGLVIYQNAPPST